MTRFPFGVGSRSAAAWDPHAGACIGCELEARTEVKQRVASVAARRSFGPITSFAACM